MRKIRTYREVTEPAGSEVVDQVVAQRERLAARLARIGSVIIVASGKGGVGKSALTANLAALLASRGRAVGALDSDLNGPSLARMTGVAGARLTDTDDGVGPPAGAAGVRVISMELFQDAEDRPLGWKEPGGDAHLWRGALEGSALREFLSDVAWGDLDYLMVDVPPGTDRIARLLELVPDPARVLLVTTPSEMSRAVVARSARLLRDAGVERVGLVGNMTEWVCPDCGAATTLFEGRGVERLARESGLDVWARVPFDPRLALTTDRGRPFALEHPDTPAGRALAALADLLEADLLEEEA